MESMCPYTQVIRICSGADAARNIKPHELSSMLAFKSSFFCIIEVTISLSFSTILEMILFFTSALMLGSLLIESINSKLGLSCKDEQLSSSKIMKLVR